MKIDWIKLRGYRNFESAQIIFNKKSLVIGSNDVGKTNLLYAIRLLLDKNIAEAFLEPSESDFHVKRDGNQVKKLEVLIKLSDIKEDAVVSKLKGYLNDSGDSYLKYTAIMDGLKYNLFIGHSESDLIEIESRHYLKYIHFRYMQSTRDITNFVKSDKKHLLKLSKENREENVVASDSVKETQIKESLVKLNKSITDLSYVSDATRALNGELQKLAYHNSDYSINLESTGINFNTFLDQLNLGAKTGQKSIGLGGDGRNNQILMALWKVKSEREHDISSEAVIYCVEEPESHLHPHQQRKISEYLINELNGQVIVTTHSPQITAEFQPDSIIRLIEKSGKTTAASNGCSPCIDSAWKSLGYRISILPAEAFFADAVLLVEGPSEVMFYHKLAEKLKLDINYWNISILSVDGIAFEVYIKILNSLEIPWVLRTDNDVSKVPNSDPPKWRYAGLNRALVAGKQAQLRNVTTEPTDREKNKEWLRVSKIVNPLSIYIAKKDLENDLSILCEEVLKEFAETDSISKAIEYIQQKKATRMYEFLSFKTDPLTNLKKSDPLAKPLLDCIAKAEQRILVRGQKRKKSP